MEPDEESTTSSHAKHQSDDDSFNPEFQSKDLKELFDYIHVFTPQEFDLESKLKPFVPEFIPAIGDIDAFIKIPRPDLKPDTLGLVEIDEPSVSNHTDPRVFNLQLRAISKSESKTPHTIHSIEANELQTTTSLTDWLNSYEQLQSAQPCQFVSYTRPMPDIERLMQAWPPTFENELHYVSFAFKIQATLAPAGINLSLQENVKLISALLDVPVYNEKNTCLIESLHVIFTLYSEFKANAHFQNLESRWQAQEDNFTIANAAEPDRI